MESTERSEWLEEHRRRFRIYKRNKNFYTYEEKEIILEQFRKDLEAHRDKEV